MKYKNCKNIGKNVSLLGMGCMRFPFKDGSIDFEPAEEMIDYAYANGVNYFDTAYVYADGESERTAGRALEKYPRESFMLATKLPNRKAKSSRQISDTFEEQLERCRVDYFDFYLLHNVNERSFDDFSADHVLAALDELKARGKIRQLGFSAHASAETIERFTAVREWDFGQLQINYFDWDYQNAKAKYDVLTRRGIPVIVMEPVRGGRLSQLCPEAAALLKAYAPNKSTASWAIRFAAELPNVLTVLSGMSTLEQVIDNVNTISGFTPLSDKEHEILLKTSAELKRSMLLPCTKCRYCDGCPAGIDIPGVLSAYNDYLLSEFPLDLMPLTRLPEENKPDKCTSCGLCVEACPQNIDVPGFMSKTASEVQKIVPPSLDV
ncbi:MAG: aldo/keto reductase [Oscillospiraceae bacterium]|nr:aldo/keto reductase [Oscillospiraceae bacterium]